MDNFPQILIDQYLKASNKLKKFDRVVFKRFTNLREKTEVHDEFARLAAQFESAAIFQYAAMCHLGVAKCAGNAVSECHAYLKAARAFLKANETSETLRLRSARGEYREGALRCYTQALERTADDAALKAAIIREMRPLQPHFDGTSSFASPAHRIYELELAAHGCLQRRDFLGALQQLDDIFDNVTERKQQDLYEELMRRVEVLRLLLLVALNLPPSRQSPSHIKLIEFYWQVGQFEQTEDLDSSRTGPGVFVPQQMQYSLAEVVVAWCERRSQHLKMALDQFTLEFSSLNSAHRFVVSCICEDVERHG